MGSALRVGDLVTPARVPPTFREKHGFGVVTKILTESLNKKYTTYEVKFVKSLKAFRFSYDALRHYGQD